MKFFGKSKKAKVEETPIPETSEFPLKAYVYRLLPEKVGKIQVAGRVPGDFDGFQAAQDLEDMVAKICGGGTYRCKVVKSGDTKQHVGYHCFVIPGSPMMDGEPVDEHRAEKERAEAKKVEKIEEEIEVEEAQSRLDETKAKRRQKQRTLGLIDGDDDDDAPATPTFGMPGFEDPRIAQLLAAQQAMEKRLEEKDREMLTSRHEAEMRSLRDEMNRKLEMVSAKKGDDGSVGVMMTSQMEAIKAMMASSQAQTSAMLSSNSEMIKLIMSRDPSTGINDRVDRLVEKLLDSKSSTGKEVMEAMKESFNTGIMMARGGEQTPTTMTDVAREFSGRVLDIVGDFMHQKGQMTKEAMAQEIQKATSRVVGDLKKSLLPQAVRNRVLPPGAVPAGTAMPDGETASAGPPISREELKNRVDKVMVAFLSDIANGTEEWKAVAQAQIPPDELRRIGEFTFDNVAQYSMVHGSPDLVRQVMAKLMEMGAVTAEQANMLMKSYGIQVEPLAQPAQQVMGATVQSDDDVLADDTEEDESLLGDEEPEPQGDAIPVPQEGEEVPQKPAKHKRKPAATD